MRPPLRHHSPGIVTKIPTKHGKWRLSGCERFRSAINYIAISRWDCESHTFEQLAHHSKRPEKI